MNALTGAADVFGECQKINTYAEVNTAKALKVGTLAVSIQPY